MRKITTLLLSVLLLCSISIAAFAEEPSSTTITATVPDSHTITVSADGADVFCNGQSGSQFTVDRLSEPELLIRAVSGKAITQILLNGDDIAVQVKGGFYTLEPVYENMTLTVVTRDAPEAQGKTYTVQGTVMRNGQPVEGITIELRSILKTDVTDSSGRFSFSNVECGKHSLTAIENGRVIGYTELMLTEGDVADLSLANGVYTVTANRNEIGINLALSLTENTAAVVQSLAGVPAAPRPNTPQTGDNGNVLLWGALMLISFAGLWTTLGYRRKKY